MNPNNNSIQAVENYFYDHLNFPTIDINKPFFFGFMFNEKNIPILANGEKSSRVYIFYCLPMFVFGRSNPNRKISPKVIGICSNTIENFNIIKDQIISRWEAIPEFMENIGNSNNFVDYFVNQWLSSQWLNWKLFS
ncbi:unnamed protein product [Brachionus calyciflorus]|uniref:Uncharacterized protein n=1 Tax=Brachionus calyciflorus TaxID=104777 RepID=A0A814ETH5_9BILA|nr:unnamed protein product [Brachionus calyciflorus]